MSHKTTRKPQKQKLSTEKNEADRKQTLAKLPISSHLQEEQINCLVMIEVK